MAEPIEPAETLPVVWTLTTAPAAEPLSDDWFRGWMTMWHNGLRACNMDEAARWAREENRWRHADDSLHPIAIPGETIAWCKREVVRFGRSEYFDPPALYNANGHRYVVGEEYVNLTRYPHHFLHISLDHPAGAPVMVSYTPSDAYGRRNRKVRVKPGRYLAQFYPEIPNEVRIQWATAIDARYGNMEMRMETDPATIATIYATCPLGSCMSYPADHFGGKHPCGAYGAPGDLALAYLGEPGENLQARAVIWPDRKLYKRVYGEGRQHILEKLLKDDGYTYAENFVGARILAITHRDALMCPYLDFADWVTLSRDGQYLVLNGETGDRLECKHQHGYCNAELECEHCGECYTSTDSESPRYCQDCVDESWTCAECEETYIGEDDRERHNYNYYCTGCFNDQFSRCADCSRVYANEDVTTAQSDLDMGDHCPRCFTRATTACVECDETVRREDVDGKGICESCRETPDAMPPPPPTATPEEGALYEL